MVALQGPLLQANIGLGVSGIGRTVRYSVPRLGGSVSPAWMLSVNGSMRSPPGAGLEESEFPIQIHAK